MTQVQRKVKLRFHTRASDVFLDELRGSEVHDLIFNEDGSRNAEVTDAQLLALTAIRTCYSPGKPAEIIAKEGARYLKSKASDGGKGTDADRLIRMIKSSGHTSTFEGITFNFAVEGVSRALLAQLTRHRIGTGFSVQSQRYVKFGSDDRSGGFDYVVPDTVGTSAELYDVYGDGSHTVSPEKYLESCMTQIQEMYDTLRKLRIPAEDARVVLPNAAACNLVLTFNLRSLLDFYGKRKAGNGAQAEIAGLSEDLKNAVIEVEPWVSQLFESEAV